MAEGARPRVECWRWRDFEGASDYYVLYLVVLCAEHAMVGVRRRGVSVFTDEASRGWRPDADLWEACELDEVIEWVAT